MRGLLLVTVVLLAIAVPRVAAAQTSVAQSESVTRGRALYLEADFARAADVFRDAMEAATSSRTDVVEAVRYLATIEGIEGHASECERLAAIATTLSASVTPAEGAPPSVTAAFEAARTRSRAQAAIGWTVGDGATERTVVARVAPGAATLGSTLHLHVSCGDERADAVGPEVSLTVHDEAAQHCEARAELASGDVLFRAELPLPGLHPAAVTATAPGPASDDTALIAGLTLGGIVVVALAIAIPVAVALSPTEGHPTMVVLELR